MPTTEKMIELAAERVENERAWRIAGIQLAARQQRHSDDGPLACECGEMISEARRRAVPGARQCIECATISERRRGALA